MRITYLHQYFVTPEMSGGTRSYELAKRLAAAGHDVHMITSDTTRTGKPYESEIAGIRVTWIPVPYSNKMGTIQRIKAFLSFAIQSTFVAAQSPADIVFATSTPLLIAIPGVITKWRQRAPMVFEVRDLWPEMPIAMGVLKNPVSKWLARQLERFAYRNAHHVVALSPGMKQGVVDAGYPADQITVIPNACDVERFNVPEELGHEFRSQYSWLGDRKLIVYAGTLGRVNGVSYLVDIASHMIHLDPEIRFLVVGSGMEEHRVRTHAQRLGVWEQNFFMLPKMPKEDIPAVLSAADICTSLFLDIKEMWINSANKFFDALAAGRAIAINYGGWHRDLIDQFDIGLVLPPGDTQEAAQLLLEYIHDNDWLTQSARHARSIGAERFDRDSMANRLSQILIDTCNQKQHA